MVAGLAVANLGREMRVVYEGEERPAVADAFLRACADAVTTPEVRTALEEWPQAKGFRVSVTHPDDGREFVPPEHL